MKPQQYHLEDDITAYGFEVAVAIYKFSVPCLFKYLESFITIRNRKKKKYWMFHQGFMVSAPPPQDYGGTWKFLPKLSWGENSLFF